MPHAAGGTAQEVKGADALRRHSRAKSVLYLDPRGHVYTVDRQMSDRLGDVRGAVAALLDNGNDTSRFFFDGLAEVLQNDYGVRQVILTTKFTSTKPASPELIQQMAAEADFLVAGVAL